MTTREPRFRRQRLGGCGLLLAVIKGPRVRFEVEWREVAPARHDQLLAQLVGLGLP